MTAADIVIIIALVAVIAFVASRIARSTRTGSCVGCECSGSCTVNGAPSRDCSVSVVDGIQASGEGLEVQDND